MQQLADSASTATPTKSTAPQHRDRDSVSADEGESTEDDEDLKELAATFRREQEELAATWSTTNVSFSTDNGELDTGNIIFVLSSSPSFYTPYTIT